MKSGNESNPGGGGIDAARAAVDELLINAERSNAVACGRALKVNDSRDTSDRPEVMKEKKSGDKL